MLFSQFLLIAQSLNEEQRCELVYYTVPKLSGVIGHWNGLLDPIFQRLKQLNLFHAQSSRCTSWITLQEGLLDIFKSELSLSLIFMHFFIINDHDGFFKHFLLINCNNVSEFTPSSGYKCVHALVYTKL